MPSELQSLVDEQAVLHAFRTQCLPLDPQSPSTRHSTQRSFAVSQILVEQSLLLLQVATATHLLAVQACPVEQSESAVHCTHTPRVLSQMGSLEQSLLLVQAVKVTQLLPKQWPPDGQSDVFTHWTHSLVTGSHSRPLDEQSESDEHRMLAWVVPPAPPLPLVPPLDELLPPDELFPPFPLEAPPLARLPPSPEYPPDPVAPPEPPEVESRVRVGAQAAPPNTNRHTKPSQRFQPEEWKRPWFMKCSETTGWRKRSY